MMNQEKSKRAKHFNMIKIIITLLFNKYNIQLINHHINIISSLINSNYNKITNNLISNNLINNPFYNNSSCIIHNIIKLSPIMNN